MITSKVVRNPLLGLPAAQKIKELPTQARKALYSLLKELGAEANEKALYSWHKGKAPMAVYWKAVSAYVNHAARICR